MMDFILDKKLSINGRQIACKVTGDANAPLVSTHFVLMIPGGPGFRSSIFETSIEKMIDEAKLNHKTPPHFILYDPLGCGDSDKPTNPDEEYTFPNFIEVAAKVAETVKEELGLEHLDLSIHGHSFGGMIAMALPVARPEWVEVNAEIRLRTVISSCAPNALNEQEPQAFVDQHYSKHPQYLEMKNSVTKIYAGKIADQEDYLRSIVFILARLYADDNETKLNGLFGRFLQWAPNVVITILQWIDQLIRFNAIHNMLVALTGFSVEVMNHFFAHNDGQFNLVKLVAEHKEIYSKIAVCCIGGNRDYIANSEQNAKILQAVLPNDIALFVLDSKHSISVENPELCKQLIGSMLIDGLVNEEALRQIVSPHPLAQCIIPNSFRRQLAFTSSNQSTKEMLREFNDKPAGLTPNVITKVSSSMLTRSSPSRLEVHTVAIKTDDFDLNCNGMMK